ncbi:MAG TPA: hypothetical protein VKR21_17695 [Solirubrobacteraceae bacterium]|nr:hypothetical protein [Solirubrobacteraceae bacterium]
MSVDLDRARALVQAGKHKKALRALWVVEARARTDYAEAEGLAELATAIRAHVTGGALSDCNELLAIAEADVRRLASDPRTGALVVVPECRCLGGFGVGIEPSESARVDLIFHQDDVRITQSGRLATMRYADLASLEVGKPAVPDDLRSKTKSAAVRVGTTAAIGVVMLPVALPLLFLKGGKPTGFVLRTDSAEVFLVHVSEMRPEEWRILLSEVFLRLETARRLTSPPQPDASELDLPLNAAPKDDTLARLERLAKLREQGVISEVEMEHLKREVLQTN